MRTKPKFKIGDKVRCVDGGAWLTAGKVYTIVSVSPDGYWYRVIDDSGEVDGYSGEMFELVDPNPVLAPEEVFEHLRKGTKLQWSHKDTANWCDHSGTLNRIKVNELLDYNWRIKPEPEVIELNGKKYREITE